MLERPRPLTWLAFLLFGIALSLPVQIMIMHGHAPWELPATLQKLSPLNALELLLAVGNGILLLRASRWTLVASPIFLIVAVYNNWLVGQLGTEYSDTVTSLASLLVLLAHGALFTEDSRKVLVDPRLRWWLTPQRFKVLATTVVRPVLGGQVISRLFDLSETGAFICMDEEAAFSPSYSVAQRSLVVGSHCSIRIKLDQVRVLHCNAEIVRLSQGGGAYPTGFGVRFFGMTRAEQQTLTAFLANQHGPAQFTSADTTPR